jgi:hypothetical protein
MVSGSAAALLEADWLLVQQVQQQHWQELHYP